VRHPVTTPQRDPDGERLRFASKVKTVRLLQKRLFGGVLNGDELALLRTREKELDVIIQWIFDHREGDLFDDAVRVSRMREVQRHFVAGSRSGDTIRTAKAREASVDAYLDDVLTQRQSHLTFGPLPLRDVIDMYTRRAKR
jgi:hypothetical protein